MNAYPPNRMGMRCAVVFCVISLPLYAARSEDLVINGGFDENTASWEESQVLISVGWVPADADGSPFSGSAFVLSGDPRLDVALGISQCMNLFSTDFHDFAGSVYRPSGQSEDAVVGFFLDWRSGDCGSGSRIGLTSAGVASSTDSWELIEGSVEPPFGTLSVVIHAYINFLAKNETYGIYQVYFDNIEFVPEPSRAAQAFVAALMLVALAGRRVTQ